MTQNLKIEVLTGDISIDGMVVTNLVTKEELSTAIVKKADLGADGKIPTSQLPAEIVNTAGIVDGVKLQLETSIKDAVDESNAYAESYTDNALASKADLVTGKVPLEQLPAIDQYPQFGTALSSLSTSILTAMKQRTDQLEKTKADLGEDGKVLREQIPSYEKISGLPEQLEVMSTQTAAVSGELDEHKLQTADQIDTLKENIEANVQQLTDRQSHLMRTYATKELGVDAKVGVKPGEYFYVRSTNEEEMLIEYQNIGGSAVETGKSYPSSSYVESTVYAVGSITEMLSLSESFRRRVIQVKATGAMYQYDSSRANVDDGVYIRAGWVLIGFHDQLLAGTAGLRGDGTNEHTKLKALLDVASILKKPINLCGLGIHTSNIVATGDIKLVGSGGIKLFAGSNGTLLTTAYDLIIDGDIEIDQDKVNNSGGTVSAESHCSIKHSGDNLILKGARIKPSASINVVTRAKKKVLSQDTEVDGGMITFYAIAPTARVDVLGGEYKNAHLYDNIQILNGGDVVVEGVKSHDSARSCIVIGNSTGKARIYGNTAYNAKVDGANQGGWGIAASVNSQDSVIGLNVCYNNQRGPITVDTYPDSGPSVDNRIVVTGNICNAMYNNGYGTSGMVLNNAKHANVSGNIIFKAAQGILGVDCDFSTVHGNIFIDCRDYFASFNTSHDVSFKDNILDGCPITGAAAIRFIDCNRFYSGGHTIRNLTGAAGFVYRVSGNSKDWTIDDDDCIRTVAGSGYVFHILGAGNTGGRIRRSRFKGDGVKGWDWYIVSDNLAQFSTHDNEIDSVGTNYITSGANVTAGDDTVNGSRNYWPSIPTAFKSRIGQIATIANIQKTWTGTAWVSANVVAVTYDPPSIAAGASATTNVAVTGAVFGDFVQASFSAYDANIEITAVVSGTNQVTVKFKNIGTAPIDLGSGTLRVKVS